MPANPFMISGQQESGFAGSKAHHAGNQMLDGQMNSAEAGLKYQADAENA